MIDKVGGTTAAKKDFNKNTTQDYYCSICGKKYKTAKERAQCELRDSEKLEKDAEIKRKEQLKAEQEKRKAEVDKSIEDTAKLMIDYLKDYSEGSYRYYAPITDAYKPTNDNAFWTLYNIIATML